MYIPMIYSCLAYMTISNKFESCNSSVLSLLLHCLSPPLAGFSGVSCGNATVQNYFVSNVFQKFTHCYSEVYLTLFMSLHCHSVCYLLLFRTLPMYIAVNCEPSDSLIMGYVPLLPVYTAVICKSNESLISRYALLFEGLPEYCSELQVK